jgi:hypothetical protein
MGRDTVRGPTILLTSVLPGGRVLLLVLGHFVDGAAHSRQLRARDEVIGLWGTLRAPGNHNPQCRAADQ